MKNPGFKIIYVEPPENSQATAAKEVLENQRGLFLLYQSIDKHNNTT
jgi:hypothetical protein